MIHNYEQFSPDSLVIEGLRILTEGISKHACERRQRWSLEQGHITQLIFNPQAVGFVRYVQTASSCFKIYFMANPFYGTAAHLFIIILKFIFTLIFGIKTCQKKFLDTKIILFLGLILINRHTLVDNLQQIPYFGKKNYSLMKINSQLSQI